MSKLVIKGMRFHAPLGYYPEEQIHKTEVEIEVSYNINLKDCGENDLLEDTVNYETVYQIVKSKAQRPTKLVEHLCLSIHNALSIEFSELLDLSVKVVKRNPPLSGEVEAIEVIHP